MNGYGELASSVRQQFALGGVEATPATVRHAVRREAGSLGDTAVLRLADRVHDRRVLVGASVSCALAGLVGITAAPDAAPLLWVTLMGLGQGGGFALGLVKLVDYAPSPAASARLSALVFLVSYSTASLGPLVFGAMRDASGGFTAPFAVLVTVSALQLVLVPRMRPGRLTEPRVSAGAGGP